MIKDYEIVMATEEDSAPVENGHGGIPARDGFSGR